MKLELDIDDNKLIELEQMIKYVTGSYLKNYVKKQIQNTYQQGKRMKQVAVLQDQINNIEQTEIPLDGLVI